MAVPTIRPHSTHQKPFMVPSIKWLSNPAARITSAVAVYSPRFKARCGSVPSLARTKNVAITVPITVHDIVYKMTCVSMGNPHAVVFIDRSPREFPLEQVGPLFEHHPCFPDRTNTEFAFVQNRQNIEMRVWERGSGETLACGTGACATAVAAILGGYVDHRVTVHLLGGDLQISWSGKAQDSVRMTGPATTVFSGKIDL